MISVKDVYDAYPHSDLLPIDPPTESTTLEDIESVDVGDSLFLFIVREICNPNDEMDHAAPLCRMEMAMNDLAAVHNMLENHPFCLGE